MHVPGVVGVGTALDLVNVTVYVFMTMRLAIMVD